MATIITRAGKGAPLSWNEADANFINLNTELSVHIDDAIDAHASSAIGYIPAGTGAVARDVQSKLRESVSVKDYTTFADYVTASSAGGFFDDDATPGVSHRVRDRLFVGDAAKYTGNRLGANGYGASWTTLKGASYLIKNATMAVSAEDTGTYATDRYGIIGFSKRMGVGAVCVNDGTDTFGRALYVEGFHQASGAGATAGVEVVVGNYTAAFPTVNAYSVTGVQSTALKINVNGGAGYTVGDADTPITNATQPSGCGIDISGYEPGTNQSFVVGINIRDSGLYRDGLGFGVAMSLAQKHKLNWEINSSSTGASLWSEVADPLQNMSLYFENRNLTVLGSNGNAVAKFRHDGGGAGTVNNFVIRGARTGIAPALIAEGTDTNINVEIQTKGTGVTRFTSHAGTGEHLRLLNSNAGTDYLTVVGTVAGGAATIGTAGASANIDIQFSPKGTGYMRFGTWTSNADAAVNGYITIRDAGGTTRKLATIA